jgi:hypothetical protein
MKISFLGLLTVIGAGLLLYYILRQATLQAGPGNKDL